MSSGLDAESAIKAIRTNRAQLALFNEEYVNWLKSEGKSFLSPSHQAA